MTRYRPACLIRSPVYGDVEIRIRALDHDLLRIIQCNLDKTTSFVIRSHLVCLGQPYLDRGYLVDVNTQRITQTPFDIFVMGKRQFEV